MGITRAATASLDVVLEVGVSARDSGHGADRRIGERRPSEVRVDDHARRVEDSAQARPAHRPELGPELSRQVAWGLSAAYVYTRAFNDNACRVDGERIVGSAR